MAILMFGNTPVPFTSSWSAEETFRVDVCPHAKLRAVCQAVAPGEGTPLFGKPHAQRQRQAIVKGLCDLCGGSLKARTKVSMSHARYNAKGATGPCIMQVEPLLHRECAFKCLQFCPALRRDLRNGTLMVRSVTRFHAQIAYLNHDGVREFVPNYMPAPAELICGHAKVVLEAFTDRDENWLGAIS